MQKIIPFLWFDDQAEEAIELYTSAFKNSKVGRVMRYGEAGPGPAGQVMTADFTLNGQEFVALNGGPMYAFTPAISFFVTCQTEAELDALWGRLAEGGMTLMELQAYPFSQKFGWLSDRFGVSWQLSLTGGPQKIIPFLMFVGEQAGKAEEALRFYTSLFEDSGLQRIERYGKDEGEPEGSLKQAAFMLAGQQFMAIDSSLDHRFGFTHAISFFVKCHSQAEVDRLWETLSAGGEQEQCGWLQDRYGVAWQIIPTVLMDLLNDPDAEKAQRVTGAMLQMTKIEIAELERAYEQV